MKDYYVCDENRIPLTLNDTICKYVSSSPSHAAQKHFRKTKQSYIYVLNRTTNYFRQYYCEIRPLEKQNNHEIEHGITTYCYCKKL